MFSGGLGEVLIVVASETGLKIYVVLFKVTLGILNGNRE